MRVTKSFLLLAALLALVTAAPPPGLAPVLSAQNTALNRTTAALLTNKSGGSVSYGDVVILDNTNAKGFTTTTTGALSTRGIGVVLEPNGIGNNASGMVGVGGWVPKVNLNTAATVGQFLKTHTVAGQATPHSSPQVEGDFAVALQATSTPEALLFGAPNGPGGGSGTVTNTGTLTSGKTVVGNGSADVTVSSLTANLVGSSSGTLAGAVASANSKLLGSGAAGSGAAYAELTLGTNLAMSGTTLNATAGNVTSTSAYASPPGSPASGDVWFPTDSFYLDRYSGSGQVPWGPLFPFTLPPASGSWTWVNQGSASIGSTRGAVVMSIPVGASANNFRYVVKTAPTAPYTITVALLIDHYDLDYFISGLFFRQSSDGKLIHCSYANAATGSLRQYLIQKFTNPSTFSANVGTLNRTLGSGLIWVQIGDDNTNRFCKVSANGYDWTSIYSEGRTTFLTADQVGWGVNNYNATYAQTLTLLSWKET